MSNPRIAQGIRSVEHGRRLYVGIVEFERIVTPTYSCRSSRQVSDAVLAHSAEPVILTQPLPKFRDGQNKCSQVRWLCSGAEEKTIMERSDWTILALAAAGGEPLTPVQLQKSLFLLGAKLPDEVGDSFYEFSPYNYGPFSSDVYADAEELSERGLVRIEHKPGRTWVEYAATPEAIQRTRELHRVASERAVAYLESAVHWCRKLTFRQLVEAVYVAFPEQRVNSVFR